MESITLLGVNPSYLPTSSNWERAKAPHEAASALRLLHIILSWIQYFLRFLTRTGMVFRRYMLTCFEPISPYFVPDDVLYSFLLPGINKYLSRCRSEALVDMIAERDRAL